MRRAFAVSVTAALLSAIIAALSFSRDSPDGNGLYARYCENCHGQLSRSDVRGATLDEIRYAVTSRMCGESGANRLTDAELDALARALSVKTR